MTPLPTHHDFALAVECMRLWCATDGALSDPWVFDLYGRRCIAASDQHAAIYREVPATAPLGRCCAPGTRADADVPKFAANAGPEFFPSDAALLAALTPAIVAAREWASLGLRPRRRDGESVVPVVYMLWTATDARAAIGIVLARDGAAVTAPPEPRPGESRIIIDARYLAALPGRPIGASCDVGTLAPMIIDMMHPSGAGLHRAVIAQVRP